MRLGLGPAARVGKGAWAPISSLPRLWNLQMWQPREFLFLKVLRQYLHVTSVSDFALCMSRMWRESACQDSC